MYTLQQLIFVPQAAEYRFTTFEAHPSVTPGKRTPPPPPSPPGGGLAPPLPHPPSAWPPSQARIHAHVHQRHVGAYSSSKVVPACAHIHLHSTSASPLWVVSALVHPSLLLVGLMSRSRSRVNPHAFCLHPVQDAMRGSTLIHVISSRHLSAYVHRAGGILMCELRNPAFWKEAPG